MPSPSLSNDHGFPHAASTLTCVKSSGPSVPGSLGALKALLFNHHLVLRAEPGGDQTRFHTRSPHAHPYLLCPFPGLLDRVCVASLHNTLLMETEALPISCRVWGSQGQPLTPLLSRGNPRFTIILAAHQQQGKFKACAAAGSRVSLHPGWHQGDLLPNMRITHESQFLQKSRVSLYASGPPWIPALW